MAVILITGANGQLGNELKIVSKNFYGYDFIFTDIDNLDITNHEQLSGYIGETRPDWIINCAAYNLVDKAESEPDLAILLNGLAVNNITEIIRGSECRFIHISSDYVYDGKSLIVNLHP
jgi:dTDP-4-dehydrorhamnose reductase